MRASRSGTVLIVVAGISGLLASLTLAFLAQVTNEASSHLAYQRMVQARIMLTAACNYLQEASRIGWEPASYQGRFHQEASGWIDVRDGQMGPKLNSDGNPPAMNTSYLPMTPVADRGGLATLNFPIGKPVRFPMYAMVRPPYAIKRAVGNNPINQNPLDSEYLRTLLRFPDPLPAVDNGWRRDPADPVGTVTADHFTAWSRGDPTPRPETFGLSWFRLMREPGGSVFLVTCGSGGTMGYRSWEEVLKSQDDLSFFPSRDAFEGMQRDETRIWYRVEWSPLVRVADANILFHDLGTMDHYLLSPINASIARASQVHQSFGGTIAWVQRLPNEPTNW